ncbi:unnamed protein product [Rotaria socialis]|uniref:Caspase-8 n=1 Tax=Rotaria socialis TaxID=392032 RepID=A0A817QVD9_9BILA|nr:unnamed protein product [Rotaria socialis]CAF4134547.1 unnamed protein product [Rotaria socialis]
MWDITKESISQCALTLGQFDSETVNLLVSLFHHQNASQLVFLSNNLKEKFENLLTTKIDNDGKNNDTPLTRIELAIMIHFKEKYLSESTVDYGNNQLKSNVVFSIDDELNLAYCFLLAQIDDRLSHEKLNDIKFLLNIRQPVDSLFDIYKNLGKNFPTFFSSLIESNYFAQKLVAVDQVVRNFQSFIKRYEDFVVTFEKHYKLLSDAGNNNNNNTQTHAVINQNDPHEVSSFMMKLKSSNYENIKPLVPSSPVEKAQSEPVPHRTVDQSAISLSLNVPRKGLCVIINIRQFISSDSVDTPNRTGSDKDVDLIKIIFNKLNFTILECKIDFKKDDLDRALNYIDDQSIYGEFDCLIMFIMSHGLLHSFFTADSKEVIIRDIVTRYADSSVATIWAGKTRIFFIQACRSVWPQNMQSNKREGVQQNDLSPKMLVAYSCSANEASKRSPSTGSSYIQVLCIMLLRFGHYLTIQTILHWTKIFIIKRDEYSSERSGKSLDSQQPEYIENEFSTNFRFSVHSLYDTYSLWTFDKQLALKIPLQIWKEIYDLVFKYPIVDH